MDFPREPELSNATNLRDLQITSSELSDHLWSPYIQSSNHDHSNTVEEREWEFTSAWF